MSELHIPVLLNEILKTVKENTLAAKGLYGDFTLGRGGHAEQILKMFPEFHMIGMDQDHEAIQYCEKKFKIDIQQATTELVHSNFGNAKLLISDLDLFKQHKGFDVMLADLGVSSPQLDEGGRGFSFMIDGPLDMRMDQSHHLTAKTIVNTWNEHQLAELFKVKGEIRNPYKVVRALLEKRESMTFETTKQLAELVEKVDGWRKKGFHPATQYFMALRLEVNQELEVLEDAMLNFIEMLKPDGILMVISFHSLEDRIIKTIFKNHSEGHQLNSKVIQPSELEIKENKRSRSSKLRVFIKRKKVKKNKYAKQRDAAHE